MRIVIIGPSASGKSTLAKKISDKFNVPHIDLDYIFFKILPGKKRVLISPEKYIRVLNNNLKKESWIIEGVNPVAKAFQAADIIIFLRPSIITCLYRQWGRYFTDKRQREEHGFISNIRLSRFILKQYFSPEYAYLPEGNPPSLRLKKIWKHLKPYKDKVKVLKSNQDKRELLIQLERGLALSR